MAFPCRNNSSACSSSLQGLTEQLDIFSMGNNLPGLIDSHWLGPCIYFSAFSRDDSSDHLTFFHCSLDHCLYPLHHCTHRNVFLPGVIRGFMHNRPTTISRSVKFFEIACSCLPLTFTVEWLTVSSFFPILAFKARMVAVRVKGCEDDIFVARVALVFVLQSG